MPSGHSGPVLTLSNAAHSSLFHPHLLVSDVGVWGTFLLGVAFRHVICGFYLLFLPVRLPSVIRKPPRTASARVSWCLETSSIKTPFPGRVSIPSSFVSLFIFYILSYPLSKTMGCFSGHLMSSASDQKLFCEVCSAFNCSFDKFVGEKVVSPSYSFAILAPSDCVDLICSLYKLSEGFESSSLATLPLGFNCDFISTSACGSSTGV